MEQKRIQVLVEIQNNRPCRFYLPPVAQDQVRASDIESRHWFLRKLEAAYESTRRAIDSAENGLLRWLRKHIEYLESQVDPAESLMRQLRGADIVELVHPSQFEHKKVRRFFRQFVRRRLLYHRQWLLINILALPLTGLMMFIPGPNIFFGWNAFRLVCHYLARDGGKRFVRGHCEIQFVPQKSPITVDDQKMLA